MRQQHQLQSSNCGLVFWISPCPNYDCVPHLVAYRSQIWIRGDFDLSLKLGLSRLGRANEILFYPKKLFSDDPSVYDLKYRQSSLSIIAAGYFEWCLVVEDKVVKAEVADSSPAYEEKFDQNTVQTSMILVWNACYLNGYVYSGYLCYHFV